MKQEYICAFKIVLRECRDLPHKSPLYTKDDFGSPNKRTIHLFNNMLNLFYDVDMIDTELVKIIENFTGFSKEYVLRFFDETGLLFYRDEPFENLLSVINDTQKSILTDISDKILELRNTTLYGAKLFVNNIANGFTKFFTINDFIVYLGFEHKIKRIYPELDVHEILCKLKEELREWHMEIPKELIEYYSEE